MKLKRFLKQETVLSVAAVLAVLSMFFVPPDADYLGYIDLRTLAIPEDALLDLWKTEKHLVQLLHFDTPSPTWFLDECGKTGHLERRLLLTHRDLGPEFSRRILQPHLDFSSTPHTLFTSREVGDDILRVLNAYQQMYAKIQESAAEEALQLRLALRWFPRIRLARQRT